jgi:hypothetical protein
VQASYPASYVYDPTDDAQERFLVSTDPHGLAVRYGAFLIAILEQVVFPSLPADIAGDSFGDVLVNIVGCDAIAASVSSDPVAAALIEGVCVAGLEIAAQEIEDQLFALEVGAVDPSVGDEGLAAGGSFVLFDEDQDLTTEVVGDYQWQVQWNDPADPAASADIAAAITGDGSRHRASCTDDATCGADMACVPRGSYTKVARVELGCERKKGAGTGGAACVGDADCGSGLCAPVGAGGALQCFRACDAVVDCAAGQICDVGGSLDLDVVLPGLGDVGAPGCSAP